MFIPPPNYQPEDRNQEAGVANLRLKASHLQVDRQLAAEVFGADQNALIVYYPDKQSLLIAPVSDTLFKQLHKAGQYLIKDRNAYGDKTIALHDLLIDHQLDATDRELDYEWQRELGILNVKM